MLKEQKSSEIGKARKSLSVLTVFKIGFCFKNFVYLMYSMMVDIKILKWERKLLCEKNS